MKYFINDSICQIKLLQVLQKNKVTQGKSTECQHLYYTQFLKDVQSYNLKAKRIRNY